MKEMCVLGMCTVSYHSCPKSTVNENVFLQFYYFHWGSNTNHFYTSVSQIRDDPGLTRNITSSENNNQCATNPNESLINIFIQLHWKQVGGKDQDITVLIPHSKKVFSFFIFSRRKRMDHSLWHSSPMTDIHPSVNS